jgi:hypothetical protein
MQFEERSNGFCNCSLVLCEWAAPVAVALALAATVALSVRADEGDLAVRRIEPDISKP